MAQANKILADSLDSYGSAMEEYQVYLDSIEGKIQGLKTEFQILSSDVIDDDVIKDMLDFLTSLISGADKLVDKVGILKLAIIGITTGLSLKNVGELNSKLNTPVYAQPQTKCA